MLKLTYKWVIDGNPFAVQLMHAERLDVEQKTWDHRHVRELEQSLRDDGHVEFADEIIAEIGASSEDMWNWRYMEINDEEPQRTVREIADNAKLMRIEQPEPEPEKPSVVGWVLFAVIIGAVVIACIT